jgi:hypothetical protein
VLAELHLMALDLAMVEQAAVSVGEKHLMLLEQLLS